MSWRRIALCVMATHPLLAQSPAADSARFLARARALHRAVPVIDGHNDLPGLLSDRAHGDLTRLDPNRPIPDADTDLLRLRAGGVGAQFWSAYVPASLVNGGGTAYAMEQIDIIHRMVAASPTLRFARTADDIVRAHRAGRIASLIGIEGGYAIENSLASVRRFGEMGVRYMTLTHGGNTAWADAATALPEHGGLTRFGEAVVREMNRSGILVDISHVSDGTMSDALNVSQSPIIFSHSSARAVADHKRNVPDSILARLRTNGGIVMVNVFPGFINKVAARQASGVLEKEREFMAKYPNDTKRASAEFIAWLTAAMNAMESGTLSEVADHIDHLVRVAGIDHVGYGADFGQLTNHPKGLEDVSRYPYLTAELLRRGYTDSQVRKILGENMLRVMRRAEQVAVRLQRETPPNVARIEDIGR
jgi:membrane dipeptidase